MAADLGKPRRRAALFGGRKPSKKKRSVGRPDTTRAVRIADGPGIGVTGRPSLDRRLDELVARIGHQGRAGIGDERQRLALADAVDHPLADGLVRMLVIGDEGRGDAVMGEQGLGDPRVLGQHRIGGGERC